MIKPAKSFQDLIVWQKAGNADGMVKSQDNAISCGADCDQLYTYTTTVVLMATPDTGMLFGGWNNCDQPSGTQCIMTVDKNKTVVAIFADHPVRKKNDPTPYNSVQEILGSLMNDDDEIHWIMGSYDAGDIRYTQSSRIHLRGGFDGSFGDNSGRHTGLRGTISIEDGVIIFDGIAIE